MKVLNTGVSLALPRCNDRSFGLTQTPSILSEYLGLLLNMKWFSLDTYKINFLQTFYSSYGSYGNIENIAVMKSETHA